tara:strand:+ start:420 stop:788 length:369 start_codon:yes stop_codon:yes gene_type:complete
MDYNSIIKNYTEEKKENIVGLAKLNKEKMHQDNEYHNVALNTFFKLWKEHFPNVRQSKTCTGCRKSVCSFFHNVADYISSERLKAVETVEVIESVNKKAKKVKKAKKHKTLTGALSPTGARN